MSGAEIFSRLGNLTNQHLALVWKEYKQGAQLEGESRRLAEAMERHPEWIEWWGRADDLGDVSVEAVRTVTVEALAEGLIEDNPPAKRAYAALRREGIAHDEARSEIARAFLGLLWEFETRRVPLEESAARWRLVFRRIADGETAQDVFGAYGSEPGIT